MYACVCCAVTTDEVADTIRCGARSTRDITRACRAGSVCGMCRPTLRTLLSEANPRAEANPLAEVISLAQTGAMATPTSGLEPALERSG